MLPNRLIVSLFAALFLIVLNFTITSLASPYIVGDLGGDRFITTYAMAFFGFGTAITIPLARPLGFQFSRTFLICLYLFAIASLLCAAASTYFFFIASRLFMGMASGPLYPLLAHAFSVVKEEEKKRVIRWVFITILIVTPVVGGCWGGTIAYLYNWRAIFYANVPLVLIVSGCLWILLKKTVICSMKSSFDWVGWGFYAGGIFALCFVLATAQQLDWYRSPLLVTLTCLGIPALGYFILRCFERDVPVMRLRFLAKPLFSLALFGLAILFAVYFGLIVLLAIWLTFDVRFTPLWIAVLLGTMGIAGLFPRFIIEERLGKLDPRIWITIAAALLALSCFYTSYFNMEINFGRIAFSRILAGFGLALFLPPVFQILSQTYPPADWIDIFEIFQSIRNLAASLGASLFTIVWQRRSAFYHERLSEKLNLQSPAVELFLKKLEIREVPGDPLAHLNNWLDQQAYSLALNDVFYLMGWILAGLFFLIFLTFFFKCDTFDIEKVKNECLQRDC